MRIHFSFVGESAMIRHEAGEGDLFVDLDAVPREGETVNVPGIKQHLTVVRTVVWYPLGYDPEGEGFERKPGDEEPFVYVVIGNRRPT